MIKWLVFIFIAAVVVTVYTPSLMHLPRADQVLYLSEVAPKEKLYDLTIGSLDLNRHRTISPGDEILFRPVVYLMLGLEKFFFQYHFMWWHLVGIALHLMVVWLLLRLLLLIEEGIAAYLLTGFFALLFVNTEMVIWEHINSYMVFVILMLLAFLQMAKIMHSLGQKKADYLVLWVVMIVASFTHEIGNVLALAMGGWLIYLYPRQRHWGTLLLTVPCIYVAASMLNAVIHPFTASFKGVLPEHASAGEVLASMAYAIKAWLFAGLFPHELHWMAGARVMIALSQKQLFFWPQMGQSLIVIVLLILGGWWALFHARKTTSTLLRQAVIVITVLLIMAYTFIIVLGRGYMWTMFEIVRVNTYYMYIFWVLAILVFYAAFSFKRIPRIAGAVMAVMLMVMMITNAQRLYAFNMQQVEDNKPVYVLVRTLEFLIEEHGKEKDFSFYVDMDYPGNFFYPQVVNKNDPPGKVYSFVEALYPQYFNPHTPKYKFITK